MQAAKDVVLSEKPTISDDSNNLETSLLDDLLTNISMLASVYHKRADSFVSRARTVSHREDDDEYSEGQDSGHSSALVPEMATAGSSSSSGPTYPAALKAAPVPDLLGDLMGFDSGIDPVESATTALSSEPPLPLLLSAASGKGLQISGQLIRQDKNVFYSLKFENHSQTPLDGFMIQFNKNTFGLAAGGPLQLPVLQPSESASTLLPMKLFQNVSEGPPNSALQVAVKNNQPAIVYFKDKIPLQALFVEDGRMERATFLETWKALPDSHEVAKELPNALITNVDATVEKLATSNLFFIARRTLKDTNQEVLYFSGKVPPSIPFLVEFTCKVGSCGVKCAVKTPTPEMAPLFFEAIEALLK